MSTVIGDSLISLPVFLFLSHLCAIVEDTSFRALEEDSFQNVHPKRMSREGAGAVASARDWCSVHILLKSSVSHEDEPKDYDVLESEYYLQSTRFVLVHCL